ncbi:ribosome maturation factor RimP [Lipingzhangella sp. LS1_29]|uniref:Ribosome maturation factor RimP n=1 Tax=Lipingzhangella rawalii TaxID=2055835 RepID=A0ABU2H5I2_9ACTN|nr:ribosome maturation factor RimP [Lipingzhangella rawalii]MDS1270562.1 ribosome maturation factor RimP [Lipingzhangella rawalii]
MDAQNRRDRLTQLLEPVLAEVGLDLEELEITPAGKRQVLRLVVDADGGVGVDTIGEVSQTISSLLDGSDVMGTKPYLLEVTSPGVDRPLTQQRHWRRAVGRLVRVALSAGETVEGRVVAADESGVTLDRAGQEHVYSYEELGDGQVQVELRRGRSSGPNPDTTAAD